VTRGPLKGREPLQQQRFSTQPLWVTVVKTSANPTPCMTIEDPSDGVYNMAEDCRRLEIAESSPDALLYVRLYRWDPPTASIGRHQDPESALDTESCAAEGVPIVRRPTGGRAVFHDRSELTYSVVSNSPLLAGSGGILETYRRIAEVLQAGLSNIGVDTRLERTGTTLRNQSAPALRYPCFASASRHELLWGTRKIAGSAQRRLRRAVLQHGSIPLEIQYGRMARILGTNEELLRDRMVSVNEAAGRCVDIMELTEALQKAFRNLLR
jgi:lipoate-protein ligase A